MQTRSFPTQPCEAATEGSKQIRKMPGRARWTLPKLALICVIAVGAASGAPIESRPGGQTRSMAQDSRLDNLRLPPGTETTAVGSLGRVRRFGEGRKVMLLIPGMGFGDGIWTEFMESRRTQYTMYAITLPGFGGTAPLPMPPDGSRYVETPWIKSSIQAIVSLMDRERIERVTIVAHWAVATQIALRLALDHPDRVEALVLISGVLKSYYDGTTPSMMTWTPEQRAAFADSMGQRWFKTVTRQTWDDNNYMSYDYAVNPRRGLFLWREAQSPILPVWIRYLLEFYSIDLTASLKNMRVPTLVVQPGFDDPAYYVEQTNYMRNLCIDSWSGAAQLSSRLEFVTIPRSRLFIMYDQPEPMERAISGFLGRQGKQG